MANQSKLITIRKGCDRFKLWECFVSRGYRIIVCFLLFQIIAGALLIPFFEIPFISREVNVLRRLAVYGHITRDEN